MVVVVLVQSVYCLSILRVNSCRGSFSSFQNDNILINFVDNNVIE